MKCGKCGSRIKRIKKIVREIMKIIKWLQEESWYKSADLNDHKMLFTMMKK